jgi:hypothetical protein
MLAFQPRKNVNPLSPNILPPGRGRVALNIAFNNWHLLPTGIRASQTQTSAGQGENSSKTTSRNGTKSSYFQQCQSASVTRPDNFEQTFGVCTSSRIRVFQSASAVPTKQLSERTIYGVGTGHVTLEGGGAQVPMPDCLCNFGGIEADVEYSDPRPRSRENFCNHPAYPAASARNRN